jgi:hypothetical protein
MKDEGTIIRGRIDVLAIKNQLWLLVIELSTGQKVAKVGRKGFYKR